MPHVKQGLPLSEIVKRLIAFNIRINRLMPTVAEAGENLRKAMMSIREMK